MARQAGLLQLGTVALYGTKIHANASRHRALSWQQALELEDKLRAKVAELMALAQAADTGGCGGRDVGTGGVGPARGEGKA